MARRRLARAINHLSRRSQTKADHFSLHQPSLGRLGGLGTPLGTPWKERKDQWYQALGRWDGLQRVGIPPPVIAG